MKRTDSSDESASQRQNAIESLLLGEQKPGTARAVIENILHRHQRGLKQYPEAMQWLAYALRKILDGEDANRAFGIVQPNNRPRKVDLNNIGMAVMVGVLTRLSRRKRKVDCNINPEPLKKSIILTVAEKFSVNQRTVERAVKNYPDLAVPLDAIPVKALLQMVPAKVLEQFNDDDIK